MSRHVLPAKHHPLPISTKAIISVETGGQYVLNLSVHCGLDGHHSETSHVCKGLPVLVGLCPIYTLRTSHAITFEDGLGEELTLHVHSLRNGQELLENGG
ncbi:hypothetical protein O6H91_15G024800 [Diphasiastrum complanatum]|uniref:Uncharacterized protein n=2 Tax=Diphasiastrum complanatum TaxID=34168 RepID=A0ACC2BGI5_DIPCM|nr:hypothetical protein O6H91_15G024100 [Diphasiastrum complanatum]KAJ7528898.1 hypothetical protein O6H91_15G024800 [Diphasiastrum complanatum]